MNGDVNDESSNNIQFTDKSGSINEKSKMSKSDKWNWFFTLLALLFSAYSIYSNYTESQVRKRIEIENLVKGAWDILGGQEGEPRLGTIIIYGEANNVNVELASRKQKEASIIDPENPKVIELEGQIFLHRGENQKALERFQRAIEINPKQVSAHNSLGLCFRALCRLEESVNSFKKAYEIKPNNPSVTGNLASTYLIMKDVDNKEAIVLLEKALKYNPNHPFLLTTLGGAFVDSGQIDEGIENLKRAIFLDKNFIDAHFNLGYAYFSQKNYDTALISFETATKLYPTYAGAYNNMGACLVRLDKKIEAVEAYKKAIYLDSEDPLYCENLAYLHTDLGNMDKAKNLFDKASSLKKNNQKECKYNRGRVTLPD